MMMSLWLWHERFWFLYSFVFMITIQGKMSGKWNEIIEQVLNGIMNVGVIVMTNTRL